MTLPGSSVLTPATTMMYRRPFAEGSFRLAFHRTDITNVPVIL